MERDEGASGAVDLPWQDELCCDSPSAHLTAEGDDTHALEATHPAAILPHYPRCSFRSSTTKLRYHQLSVGKILSTVDDD